MPEPVPEPDGPVSDFGGVSSLPGAKPTCVAANNVEMAFSGTGTGSGSGTLLLAEPVLVMRRHNGMLLPTRLASLLPLLAVLVQVGACAASNPGRGPTATPGAGRETPAPSRDLELEPVRIEVSRDGTGGTHVAMFDARELFDQAGAALDAGRHDEALALYDRLVSDFPDSQLVPPALFNAGLALEGKRDLDGALARYLDVARRSPATHHGLDAHIRAGAVMAELARWSDALRVFDQVIARRDLGDGDRIEVQARRGHVLVESGRYAEAETALTAALAQAERAEPDGHLETDFFIAMAHYYLAEIPRRQAEAVELRLPEEDLQRDIEAKAKLVLAAQRRFEDTIRLANLYWATAAGYQLGSMQEDMWRALLAAPVPSRLGPDEARIYTGEVGAMARAHLEKALEAHVMNVKVADHNRQTTPWSESSRRRMSEIQKLLGQRPDATTTASRRAP